MNLEALILERLKAEPLTIDELVWGGEIAKLLDTDNIVLRSAIARKDQSDKNVEKITKALNDLLETGYVIVKKRETGLNHWQDEYFAPYR